MPDMACGACGLAAEFSKAQLRKGAGRRCKACVASTVDDLVARAATLDVGSDVPPSARAGDAALRVRAGNTVFELVGVPSTPSRHSPPTSTPEHGPPGTPESKGRRGRGRKPALAGGRACASPLKYLASACAPAAGGAGEAATGEAATGEAVAGEAAAGAAPPPPAASTPPAPRYLVSRKEWSELPDWIALEDERGEGQGSPFPPLAEDPLFRDNSQPCVLPYLPPAGAAAGRGAAVVVPGGNYEFLHPREAAPVARWLAEALGIPAYVLRYRLLPAHGLGEMRADLAAAVLEARRAAAGGPVLAIGFSAGGHLVAAHSALAEPADGGSRPDAQALVYPCTNPDGWLEEDECGFWRTKVESSQARSLVGGREHLREGPGFVAPPPTFIVGSTGDDVCPTASDQDPYADAARRAGAPVEYLKGDFGEHGFGLKRFWATPCLAWLRGQGFGVPPDTPRRILADAVARSA